MLKHIPWRETGWAFGAVVMLAALYVGSYFALVTQSPYSSSPVPMGYNFGGSTRVFESPMAPYFVDPEYRVCGNAAASFFGPIHEIDLVLRPKMWSPSPFPER